MGSLYYFIIGFILCWVIMAILLILGIDIDWESKGMLKFFLILPVLVPVFILYSVYVILFFPFKMLVLPVKRKTFDKFLKNANTDNLRNFGNNIYFYHDKKADFFHRFYFFRVGK